MPIDSRDDDISVEDLNRRRTEQRPIVVLDVREPSEYDICNIGGTLIPLGALPSRVSELNPADEIAVICHHGNRSRVAVSFLQQRGFKNVRNVTGGIEAWAKRIDPTMRRY
jgi:rhodanese-related sulfurtransferase